ncbi:DNA-processing protein DprA [Frankia sp. AgKG'84/4]|uniref:DNA-processing protein DprA n=1 Tax=Frankia sp. AgKG'84/4 TaxID=573490 RepID=UPI00200E3437|nr:DNA-processing protein DprA [Frankia sp. AgKG'84/4]MCL9793280.1 DNA-protecting protein DprA [Frankia sp. AgKG'84/4]
MTVDHQERLARIGLAWMASRGAAIPAAPATESPMRRWKGMAASRPQVDPARVAGEAEATGWRIVVPGDDEWPPAPPGIEDPSAGAPWALWVRGDGDLRAATRRSVAVLGTRASTTYANQVSALLGEDLAARGWTVVAACALGADRHALVAAAHGDAPPIGVFADGPGLRAFERREPALRALLVSDAPPDTPSRGDRYLARQDLITYLSAGVVIVEAGWRGNTLATVAYARARGRLVMAVPGAITSPASAVTHFLIQGGAQLVDSAESISATLLAATAGGAA